jgi:hypothetical protein
VRDAEFIDTTEEGVQQELKALHGGEDSARIPPCPEDAPVHVATAGEVKKMIKALPKGRCGGPSGWTREHLLALVDDDQCLEGLAALVTVIMKGEVPDMLRPYMLACQVFCIPKYGADGRRRGIRPIAVGEIFYKVATVMLLELTGEAVQALAAQSGQFGVGVKGGAEKLAHILNMSLRGEELHKLVFKLDLSNGFGDVYRRKALAKVYSIDALKPLWRVASFSYRESSPLFCKQRGKVTFSLDSRRGVRQGDPLGPLLFALGVMDLFSGAREAGSTVEAGVRTDAPAYLDDLHLITNVCHHSAAKRAVEYLLEHGEEYGVRLRLDKSALICFRELPAEIREFADLHGIKICDSVVSTVGVPIGLDREAVKGICMQKANSHGALFQMVEHSEVSARDAYKLLLQCATPRMNYLMRTVEPNVVSDACNAFDTQVLRSFQSKMGLQDMSPQAKDLMSLGLRQGGLGLKKTSEVKEAAYLGGYAQVVSFLEEQHEEKGPMGPLAAEILRSLEYHPEYPEAVCDAAGKVTRESGEDEIVSGIVGEEFDSFDETTLHLVRSYREGPSKDLLFNREVGRALLPSKRASSIQKELSMACQKHKVHRVDDMLTTSQVRRRKAFSAAGASTWLTASDESRVHAISDRFFSLAIRQRLALGPEDVMPLRCSCESSHVHSSNSVLRENPWHCLSCKRSGFLWDARHDAVVLAMAQVCRKFNLLSIVEPSRLFARNGKRADLLISLQGKHVLVDVSVTDVCAPSHCNMSIPAVIAKREKEKYDKYVDDCRELGVEFVPFVMTAQGSFSKRAKAFLQDLAACAQDNSPLLSYSEALVEFKSALMATLQRQNGLIAYRSMHWARFGYHDLPVGSWSSNLAHQSPEVPALPADGQNPPVSSAEDAMPRSQDSQEPQEPIDVPVVGEQEAEVQEEYPIVPPRPLSLEFGNRTDQTASWLYCPLLHLAFALAQDEVLDNVVFPSLRYIPGHLVDCLVADLASFIAANKDVSFSMSSTRSAESRTLVDWLRRHPPTKRSKAHHYTGLQNYVLNHAVVLSEDSPFRSVLNPRTANALAVIPNMFRGSVEPSCRERSVPATKQVLSARFPPSQYRCRKRSRSQAGLQSENHVSPDADFPIAASSSSVSSVLPSNCTGHEQ